MSPRQHTPARNRNVSDGRSRRPGIGKRTERARHQSQQRELEEPFYGRNGLTAGGHHSYQFNGIVKCCVPVVLRPGARAHSSAPDSDGAEWFGRVWNQNQVGCTETVTVPAAPV